MYDYVFEDTESEADETKVELKNTKLVYHEDGCIYRMPHNLTKTRAFVRGRDMILLYRDIADWHPEKVNPAPAELGEISYRLGPSARAFARKPRKELLDGVTIADK